jgi:hypothetical protein
MSLFVWASWAGCGGLPMARVNPNVDAGGGGGETAAPFEPVAPISYVARVKNILTGLPSTSAEVQAVEADPTALRGLIDQWMALPEFQARMLEFFRNAFQQNQVVMQTLATNYGLDNDLFMNDQYVTRYQESLMESFPRTVWELLEEGRPFTESITTHRYMLTTAMMSMLSYLDEMNVDDTLKQTNRPNQRAALPQVTFDPKSTAALADTLDPASPSYMIWPSPVAIPTTCTTVTPYQIKGAGMYRVLFEFLFGFGKYPPCYPNMTNQRFKPTLSDADYGDWRMVTIHPMASSTGSTAPSFYDIPTLRTATDMSLRTPRQGFLGTLAFAANWGTNASNEARVTANQSLIVGIGRSINGETALAHFPVNTTDAAHASDPACAGCHSQLDPYKQFFRQSYTLYYHDQVDATQAALPATFNIDGVTATGQGVGDVLNTLATHPRFPLAWAQKLHFWATSTAAQEDDPELVRIAGAFRQSNFDWKTLVRELFSSPLITLASPTQTTTSQGVTLSIARRDQYCAALSSRLGLTDVCGMITPQPTPAQTAVAARARLLPVDTYYRAYELPSLPTNPDLFYRSSTESMCRAIADQVVDAKGGSSRYAGSKPADAIADMIATVMDLVSVDPRAGQAQQILTDHLAAALKSGASATDALKSTFTLACIAPSSVIVGL